MEKYLVTIEFRYTDAPKYEDDLQQHISKTITLGVFDTRDEANFEIYRMREETDDEVRTRLNKERKSAILAAKAERETYERKKAEYLKLKQKFEPDNV